MTIAVDLGRKANKQTNKHVLVLFTHFEFLFSVNSLVQFNYQ